jgi:hypothetical protein
MARASAIDGIDPERWQVTLLPLPKRFSRGVAIGFCGGHPVGSVEAARGPAGGCWWPNGAPELLALDGVKNVRSGTAGGDIVPGHSYNTATGAMGAVLWRLTNGRMTATKHHIKGYESTWATAAGGGSAVGVGKPEGKPGARKHDVGLMWTGSHAPAVVTAEGNVLLLATDGTRLAGNVNGRATLWPAASAPPIDLAPPKMFQSEVRALTETYQAGVAFKGMCARAALWRGTAASFTDLTPGGFQTARIFGAAGDLQVGCVRKKDTTPDGGTGSDDRAAVWQGSADRWFDLNDLLPSDIYNASTAWAIEIRGQDVLICGGAIRYEASHPGTGQESHAVPVMHPVLWTARLL